MNFLTRYAALFVYYIVRTGFDFLAAYVTIILVAPSWRRVPAPLLARLARHPRRRWIALGFALLPVLFSFPVRELFLWARHAGLAYAVMPASYLLGIFYGAFYGMAGICCASVSDRLRVNGATTAAAALVLAPPWFLVMDPWIHYTVHVLSIVLIIFIAYEVLSEKGRSAPLPAPEGTHEPPPVPHLPNPLPALLIGFFPALLVLITITVGASGAGQHLSNDSSRALLVLESIASVVCCITASVMLFRRKTSAAIIGAVLLLLLNVFLAFFFGCCAAFVGASFR